MKAVLGTQGARMGVWIGATLGLLAMLGAGCGRGTATPISATPAAAVPSAAGVTATRVEPPTLPATFTAGPPTPTQTRVVQRTWTPPPALWTATPSPAVTSTPSATATPVTATMAGGTGVTGTATLTPTLAPALAVIGPANVMSLTVVAAAGPGYLPPGPAGASPTLTATLALTATPTATPTPGGLGARIDQIVWAADGQRLAAAGAFGILLYDAAGGRVANPPARAVDTPSWATSAAFSPDGAQIAVGGVDGLVLIIDLATGELQVVLAASGGSVTELAWVGVPRAARPSGAVLVSLNGDTVNVWDVAEQAHLGSLPPAQGARLVATGGEAPLVAVGAETTVQVWDLLELLGADDPAAVAPWRVLEQPAPVTSLALSADGRRLAVGNTSGTIVLWNVVTAQTTLTLARLSAPAERLDFSPDGLLLASAHTDRQARLWAVGNGALVRVLEGHAERITSLRFAPDGRVLATAGWEGVVRVWGGVP